MREFRFVPGFITGASAQVDAGWLPGLPHALAGLACGPVFGWQAAGAGLLMAAFASFVLYLPLIALALNQGRPIPSDAATPAMTPAAHGALLALWTLTAWTVAWAV